MYASFCCPKEGSVRQSPRCRCVAMTGSVYVVLALFLGFLLYIVLRRRSARQEDTAQTSRTGVSSLRTNGSGKPMNGVQPGSQAESSSAAALPRSRINSRDSGSSHPAYPVAPAKYAAYTPKGASAPRRETQSSSAAMRAAVSQAAKAPLPKVAEQPSARADAAPWYPEPPADYREAAAGEDHGSQREEGSETPRTP